MSNKDLVSELKAHIKELSAEKDALVKTVATKDSRIKQLLLKIEDANDEVKSTVKKMEGYKNETADANEEVEKMKKKIKTIKHNLGADVLRDDLNDQDQTNAQDTAQED